MLGHVAPLALVPLAYAAVFTALFSPVLLTGGLLGTTDAVIYYYPAWATHHFAWTPNLYAGYPVGGDPQAMFWYPATWITRGVAAMFGDAVGWNAFIVSAYVLAASFAHGWAYRLTSSRLAACVAGLAYGMSGYAIAHLDHASIVHTLAWTPLVFWALEELRPRASRAWIAAGALAVGNSALAGHPQVFAYVGLLAVAYALFRARGAAGGGARYVGRAASAGALGVALAAVMLVPTVELASASLRGPVAREAFFQYGLAWAQLPQLLLPHALGGALGVSGSGAALPYFGPGIPGEIAGSVGWLPVVLAGVALVRRLGDSAPVRFFAVVALVSVVLALGDDAWVAEALFHVPGLDRFRIPPRHLFELALAVSVLAAFGVASLEALDAAARRRLAARAVGVGAVLVATAAGLLALAANGGAFADETYRAGVAPGETAPWRSPALAVQAAAVALGAAVLVAWARRPGRATAAALALAVALDLASYAAFAPWRASASAESFAMPAGLEPLRDALRRGGQRLLPLTFDAPATAAPPNRSDLWDVPSALGYGPLPLADYAALLGLSAAHFRGPDELARVLGTDDRSLDVLATRYVLVPDDTVPSDTRARLAAWTRPTREAPPQWRSVREFLDRSPRFARRDGLPGTAVYENLRALPGAWIVGEVAVATRDEQLDAIRTGRLAAGARFDPSRVALVEEAVPGVRSCGRRCGSAEIVRVEDRSVTVRATAADDAFLVLSAVDHPGWRATVDGAPAPLHRTDALLRGVALPAGAHEVRFEFAPASVRVGAVVSSCALALWIGLLVAPGRRAPRGGAAA